MRIAILTNFTKSKPEYSLYSVAVAQADTLARFGNEVTLHVCRGYKQTQPLPRCFSARIVKDVPRPPKLVDYRDEAQARPEHVRYAKRVAKWLARACEDFDAVITHDWVFTGWNWPFFKAVELTADATRRVRWLHWVHSIPGLSRDWWYLRRLGPNHKIVTPNRSGALRVATYFNTEPDQVLYVPHVEDLRHMPYQFDDRTLRFLDEHPEIMNSHVVQVYPASSDRLDAKGVRELVLVFARIKARGRSVCLVIANQAADRPETQEKVQHMIRLARRNGLVVGEDVIFTSEEGEDGEFREGVPHNMLYILMACSNAFVCPTQEETFGKFLPEVSLASGALAMVNKSLPEIVETAQGRGLLADFGSYVTDWRPTDEDAYLDRLAGLQIAQMQVEEGVMLRTACVRRYNMHAVYHKFYVPILEGSALWPSGRV